MLWFALWLAIMLASPSPDNGSTSANQATQIDVAVIGAIASVATASITAVVTYLMLKVRQVTTATHNIVNHMRTLELENQELVLRIGVKDHPEDDELRVAHDAAVVQLAKQREANAPADTRL